MSWKDCRARESVRPEPGRIAPTLSRPRLPSSATCPGSGPTARLTRHEWLPKPLRELLLQPLHVISKQFRIMIPDPPKRHSQRSPLEFPLQLLHEDPGCGQKAMPTFMDRAPGALRVAPQNGQNTEPLSMIFMEPVCDVNTQAPAAAAALLGVEHISDRCTRASCTLKPQADHLRTRHLQDADLMGPAKIQNVPIHVHIGCGAEVPGVLIQDALDHGQDSLAPGIISPGCRLPASLNHLPKSFHSSPE